MTKAEIVNEVAKSTGIEKVTVQTVVEATMESIKSSIIKGNPVYLLGDVAGSLLSAMLDDEAAETTQVNRVTLDN